MDAAVVTHQNIDGSLVMKLSGHHWFTSTYIPSAKLAFFWRLLEDDLRLYLSTTGNWNGGGGPSYEGNTASARVTPILEAARHEKAALNCDTGRNGVRAETGSRNCLQLFVFFHFRCRSEKLFRQ